MKSGPVEPVFQRVSVAPTELLGQAVSLMGNDYWMFVAVTLVGMLIASAVPLGILYGPMLCGMFLCYFQRMRGERVTFETLFRGFDFFIESLLATLIMAVASIVVIVPIAVVAVAVGVGVAVAGPQGARFAVIMMLILVPIMIVASMLVSMLFMFVYPLIADRQMKALPAIATSCRAVLANLGGIIILMLLFGLLAIAGVIACGIGTIFVTPILLGATAVLYRQVFSVRPMS